MTRRHAGLLAALLLPAGIASAEDHAPLILPPKAHVTAVIAQLEHLQHLSFVTQREFCGYLGQHPDGSLGFTPMVRGGRNGCTPILLGKDLVLVASLHTHGAYHPDVPAEFPTSLDIMSDADEGVNGYVATPGGRLWYIDGSALATVQLCGLACLPQDPDFHAGDDGLIENAYSFDELKDLELHP